MSCPPLIPGPVVAMRHAIACNIKAGTTPCPPGHSLTSIRQGWSEAQCRAYIAEHGTGAPAPAAAPAEPAPAPLAAPMDPTPAPTAAPVARPFTLEPAPAGMGGPADPAAALLAAVRAVAEASRPISPAVDPAALESLADTLREEFSSAMATESERTEDKIAGAVSIWVDKLQEMREALAAVTAAASTAPRAVVLADPAGKPRGAEVDNPHPQLQTVAALVLAGVPVMLHGPSGAGKTHLAAQVAAALGLEFGLHGAAMLGHELTGYQNAAGEFVDTVLSRQFEAGGLTCLDEHDGGSESAPLVVNALLANGLMSKGARMVQAHPDWRIVATANTVGGATAAYTGRVRLDQATLQRYALVHVDYIPAVEESIAGANPDWLKLCRAARAEVTARGVPIVSGSYRDMSNGMRALAAGLTLAQCVDMFLARATLEPAAIARRAGVQL